MMVPLGPRSITSGMTVLMFTLLYMPATRSEKLEKGEDSQISQLTATMNSPDPTAEK